MLTTVADLQEALADAKEAHAAEQSTESLAARRQAMENTAEFRSWVRGIARLRKVRQKLTDPELTAAQREKYEDELPGLEERWAELEATLSELKQSAGPAPLPEGSAVAAPQPVRLRSQVNSPGGA